MQIWLSIGAIVGTIGAALLGDLIGRRLAYFLLCIAAMGSVFWLFFANNEYGSGLLASCFVTGVCSASFYGWLPLYLPELFRTNVRATGQGFGFNFGRILAAIGSFQLGLLTGHFRDGIEIGSYRTPGLRSLRGVRGMAGFGPEFDLGDGGRWRCVLHRRGPFSLAGPAFKWPHGVCPFRR